MRDQDRKPFADALAATFATYGQVITPAIIRLWWNVLDGYRLDAVLSAISYHVGDYEGYGGRCPTPADVRRHLEVTLPQLAREQARPTVEAGERRIGELREKAARLTADVRLGLVDHTVAATELNVLAVQLRNAREDPAYVQALAGLQVREDDGEAPREGRRGWLPPFLRRAVALLSGPRE